MRDRYENLDGLRAISCLAIIAMHVRANAQYQLGDAAARVIGAWTHFVPLFMMISGFGMFCGYYERFRDGRLALNDFYARRYRKLLPFFVTLILIDIALDRSLAHVVEGLTETTLVFGLLPNNDPEVIGVCWTLGVIFLFYMLFPFFVFLCWNRRRALMAFGVSVVLALFCNAYFFTDRFVAAGFSARHSFLYCAPYFLGGAVTYLYRGEIARIVSPRRWLWLAGCAVLTAAWYLAPAKPGGISFEVPRNALLFMAWLWYAISVKSAVLSNRATAYLSAVSLELYLAQMVIFRAAEKAKLLYLLGRGWAGYIAGWLIVVVGLIVFIEVWKRAWSLVAGRLSRS